MKEVKSKQIQDILKKAKTNLVVWIIVAICAAAIMVLSVFMDDIRKSTSLHEILAAGESPENKLVHVEVSEKPYVFAYYPGDNTGKFYFLMDEEFMYIGFLSEKKFKELDVDSITENHVTVKGMTKKIPSDIKKLALEAYNEAVEKDQKLTSSEFGEYFGLIYLDETETDYVQVILILIGMIGWFAGVVGVIAQTIMIIRLKRTIKKFDEKEWEIINSELEAEDAFYYKNAKLALTKNYVIDFAGGFKPYKYRDILWMYKYEYRYNGINTQLSIILYTEDKKRHVVAQLPGYTKKSKEVNKEIMESIMSKNEKMLVGYTKENRNRMKEEYQIKA